MKLSRTISTARPRNSLFPARIPDYGLTIQKVMLKNDRGEESSQFRPGEDLVVEINLRRAESIRKQPYIILGIQGINGSCFTANMCWTDIGPRRCLAREAHMPIQILTTFSPKLLRQDVDQDKKRQ